eukprot:TRINITY_DN106283_c0_g1_i1.p1 TRINITY_DN106283_c0_g1~~TRINITY_DN106283_c0_g1_i1.p1  ORF type:complete len:595 (+),score=121.32 TRINITY_DN106283_c0_g1_i1:36-1787(+)
MLRLIQPGFPAGLLPLPPERPVPHSKARQSFQGAATIGLVAGPSCAALLGVAAARWRRVHKRWKGRQLALNAGSGQDWYDHIEDAKVNTRDEEGKMVSLGETLHTEQKNIQLDALNNVLKGLHKKRKSRKKNAPKVTYIDRPDNPWQDRCLICKDCERNQEYEGKPPRIGCNMSTLLELDMTAPFSRNNVMVTSCEIVQCIKDDIWVFRTSDGSICRAKDKIAPAFPVQVCAVCRKTTLEEGRRFKMCDTCSGVSYCSEECMAAHKAKHQLSCVRPHLPYRAEWGVRGKLRKMRNEIYPLIKKWAIREPELHRTAWLPPPEHEMRRLRESQTPKRISLPGGMRARKQLPAASSKDTAVVGGQIVLVDKPSFGSRRVRESTEKIPDPDPTFLESICMTKEEYLERHAKLQLVATEQDAELFALHGHDLEETVEEPKKNPLSVPTQKLNGQEVHARTGVRMQEMTPVSQVPEFELDEEAMLRVEAAGKDGQPVDIDKRTPWKQVRYDGQKEKDFWTPIPEEEKKEGVVYLESPMKAALKKHGLQLSDEAIENLEEMADAAKHNAHRIRWQKPWQDEEADERNAAV